MKLLLCKNVGKLGIVGDIVDVKAGYGRNYLVPQGLATEPTDTNIRALAEARKAAELERVRQRGQLEALAKRLEDVEVTVRARANEEGVLYGSVSAREISIALVEEGYPILPDQVVLEAPIRHLDNVAVNVSLADDLTAVIKVWVVREKTDDEPQDEEALKVEAAGMEASEDGDSAGE